MKVIALHGNPGSPNDWQLLKRQLPSNLIFQAPSIYNDQWIQEIQKCPDKSVVLMGHSYGAYLCLANLPQYHNKINFVLLCAPFLAGGRELSVFVRFLLGLPVLGNRLKKLSHSKLKDQLFADIISPLSYFSPNSFISPLSAPENLVKTLQTAKANIDHFETWKQMLALKIRNSKTCLRPHDVPGIAVLGEKDLISDVKTQSQVLEKFPQIQIQVWPEVGHGLIWSECSRLAEILQTELKNRSL